MLVNKRDGLTLTAHQLWLLQFPGLVSSRACIDRDVSFAQDLNSIVGSASLDLEIAAAEVLMRLRSDDGRANGLRPGSTELTRRSWRVTRSSSRIASEGHIALLDTSRISSRVPPVISIT